MRNLIVVFDENRGVVGSARIEIGKTYETLATPIPEVVNRVLLTDSNRVKFVVILWHELDLSELVGTCLASNIPVLVIKDRIEKENEVKIEKEVKDNIAIALRYRPSDAQLMVKTTNVQSEFQHKTLVEHMIKMETSLKPTSYSVPEAEL